MSEFFMMQGIINLSSFVEIFSTANLVASSIFAITESEPIIHKFKGSGIRPENFKGNIEFENVNFHYPCRPENKVQ